METHQANAFAPGEMLPSASDLQTVMFSRTEQRALWFLTHLYALCLAGTPDRERSVNPAPSEASKHHHAGGGDGNSY